MDYAPSTYDRYYALGFLISIPMGFTILSWVLTGLPNLYVLAQNRGRALWAIGLLTLALWMHLSVSWSFIANIRDLPNVTQSTAFQFSLVVLWVIATASTAPPIRMIIAVLILGGIGSALIGGLQVAEQASIGLSALGEFNLNPASSGVSILQVDGVRWLRPYGLLPHPNTLAGFLTVTVLATIAWTLHQRRNMRLLGMAVSLFILWHLLLTFSRGAWLGFGAGAFALLALLLRYLTAYKYARYWLLVTIALTIIMGGVFFVNYRSFIIARTVSSESVEMRSVADRLIFTLFAYRALHSSPENTFLDDEATQSPLIYGIGAGNFPWRSSYYLVETDYDLRGNNVHHIWLSALVETGLVGYGSLLISVLFGVDSALRQRKNSYLVERSVLITGFIALGIIGLFDHYPWTMIQFQILWWGILAIAISEQTPTPQASHENITDAVIPVS